MDRITITEEEVFNLLKNIKTDKAPAPDIIHPRLLKEGARELVKPLQIRFQKSMGTGTFLKELSMSPTSVVSNLMERIVRDRMLGFTVCKLR